MLNKAIESRGLKAYVLALVFMVLAGPLWAETQDIVIGKYKMSVAFPCVPKKQKPIIAKTEAGDIVFTSLLCSNGDSAYLLGVTEYPAQIVSSLSTGELLDSTLDDTRSKPHMRILSSKQDQYQNRPAIRHNLVDSRKPETESLVLVVLVDRNLVVAQITAPPRSAQSNASTDFLNSLKITAVKK